jgi:hypothetical protein
MSKISKLLAKGLIAAAMIATGFVAAPVAQAAPAPPATVLAATHGTAVAPTGFYCGAATSPVVCIPCRPDLGEPTCAYAPFTIPVTAMTYVQIGNHASGGERCRLYADGVGLYNWIYIDAGDGTEHAVGTVPAGTGFNIRCQARAASPSDAGIGGTIYY